MNKSTNTKLYVGNLSYNTTQEELESLFKTYGVVDDVFIVKDRESGRPRGFAFVTMETEEGMLAALEGLNGTDFLDRTLAINEARPREDRSSGNFQKGNDGSDGRGRNKSRGYQNR